MFGPLDRPLDRPLVLLLLRASLRSLSIEGEVIYLYASSRDVSDSAPCDRLPQFEVTFCEKGSELLSPPGQKISLRFPFQELTAKRGSLKHLRLIPYVGDINGVWGWCC